MFIRSLLFFFAAVFFCLPLEARAASVLQASFDTVTNRYTIGHNSLEEIPILDAPSDVDWSRVAMLHDGETYRLYAFQKDSRDTIYQFGYSPKREAYILGYQSIKEIKIENAPLDVNTKSFSMLHDGVNFRLYLGKKGSGNRLYQFAFHSGKGTYIFGHNSSEIIKIKGIPSDASNKKIAMLHDGTFYRYYRMKTDNTSLYQAAWDGRLYRYGYKSIPEISIVSKMKKKGDIAMLHDGQAYRLYFIQR